MTNYMPEEAEVPDIFFWYAKDLTHGGQFNKKSPGVIKCHIRKTVAENMDCLNDEGVMIRHNPHTQINIVEFEPITGFSVKKIIMSVEAYDWPDRMRNIDERLEEIGVYVRDLLGLGPGLTDLSFKRLARPTPTQRSCWVNV